MDIGEPSAGALLLRNAFPGSLDKHGTKRQDITLATINAARLECGAMRAALTIDITREVPRRL
jgi:hypothetical protein